MWWRRVARWAKLDARLFSVRTERIALHEALAQAQRQRRVEDYPAALASLDRAAQIAHLADDDTGLAVVDLQRAEIYTLQGRWAEAEALLFQLRHSAQTSASRVQMAYTLSALGALAWARGDRDDARAFYEQAVTVAQAAGSPGAEGRAQARLADSYLAEGNASYAAHLLKDAIPRLNMGGDLDSLMHYVGRLGEAFIAIGQEAEGERLLYRALRLAERLRDRPNERRWALALAARDLAAQRLDDAYRHYQQALAAFSPAAHDSVERAHALCQLSRVCLRLSAAAEALEHAREAARLAALHADPLLRAYTSAALGLALRAAGDSAGAVLHLREAREAFSALGSADPYQIEALRGLAAAQLVVEGDEAAVTGYAIAAHRADAIGAQLELARTHLDLGLLHLKHNRLHNAVEAWRAALAIYEAERQFALAARTRCDIASAYRRLGQSQRAMREYEQALITLNSVDDPITRGLVLANAAVAYADQGEVQSAEAFFTEAITIAVNTGDRAAEAVRRGNYGWFKYAIGRPREAVAVLEHALSISREQRLALEAAVQTNNLGLAHEALGNRAAALAYHEQALEMVRGLGSPHWEAIIKINLSAVLLHGDRRAEASALLAEALAAGRASGDIEVIVRALTAQAHLLLHNRRTGEAGVLLTEATALARRAGLRRLLADVLRAFSEQQAAANNHEQAQALWDEACRLFAMLEAPSARLQPAWLESAHAKP